MGKGDKKASSAKAAELLARSAGGGSGGFGGFSGAAPVASSGFGFGAKYISQVSSSQDDTPAATTGPSAVIPTDLDGELAAALQRLTKRDATTRLKALQTLRAVVADKPEAEIRRALGPWTYYFSRLVMDGARAVRAEACGVMGAMAAAAGRGMAPVLKFVLPPWFMAQHDESAEVAAAATAALRAAFPGDKATEALLFCRSEVLKLLADNAASTPQALGDARKESPEELQSRHERVLASTCAALAAVVEESAKESDGGEKTAAARAELAAGARSLLESAPFIKSTMGSKAPGVRRAAYSLIASVARAAPALLGSDAALAQVGPAAFGALGDKEAGNHPAMWGMVLSLAKAHPVAWERVNLPKAVLPKLWSLLRHGAHGSAEGSYPAVLPLIALLPQRQLGAAGYETLLGAVWEGATTACAPGPAQQAAADCFQECFLYALFKAGAAADEGTTSHEFVDRLIAAVFETMCLGAAVVPDGAVARSVALGAARRLAAAGAQAQMQLDAVVQAIGRAAGAATTLALETGADAPGAPSFSSIGNLLLGMRDAVPEDVAVAAARPTVSDLLPSVRSGGAPPAGTALLASLVRAMPALNADGGAMAVESDLAALRLQHSASFTADAVVRRVVDEQQSGAALEASCDLIASCLPAPPELAPALAAAAGELAAGASPAAAATLLRRCAGNAAAARSPALDAVCLSVCTNTDALKEDPHAAELVVLMLCGSGSGSSAQSLLTDAGQAAVLRALNETLQDEGDDDGARVAALRLLERCVLSPSLSTAAAATVGARLDALAAIFDGMVEEKCAMAALDYDLDDPAAAAAHSGPQADATEAWSGGRLAAVGALAASSAPQQQNAFIEALTTSLAATLDGLAEDNERARGAVAAAVAAAAAAPHAALDADPALRRAFVRSLREAIPGTEFLWALARRVPLEGLLADMGSALGAAAAADLVPFKLAHFRDAGDDLERAIMGGDGLFTAVLDLLWEREHAAAAGHLVAMAAAHGAAWGLEPAERAAVQFFRARVAGVDAAQPDAVTAAAPALRVAAPALRAAGALLAPSGLPDLAVRLCEAAAESGDVEITLAAAACFPAPVATPPTPQWAGGAADSATPLQRGDPVWYLHREGTWEAAEVITIDVSVQPASYGVRLASGVRETERGRLRQRRPDDPPPLPVQAAARSGGVGNDQVYVCREGEKKALLALLRVVGSGEGPSPAAPAVVLAAVAHCSGLFGQSDWELVLRVLQEGLGGAATATAAETTAVAETLTAQAETVAGAPLGGPEGSIAFFRQLHHKGVLETSSKGAAAGTAVATAVAAALASLSADLGTTLPSLLQTYCHVARTITSARSLPLTLWEGAQAAVCAAALSAFVSLGKVAALAGAVGQADALNVPEFTLCWIRLAEVVDATVAAADRAFLAAVAGAANAVLPEHGVGCTDALAALVLCAQAPGAARDAAYRAILLHSELVADLVRRPPGGGEDEEEDAAAVLQASKAAAADWCEELERAGVLPDLAAAAAAPGGGAAFPLAWGLLVAHLLNTPEGFTVRARLVERIKEAHGLVHALLDALLPELPLGAFASAASPSAAGPSVAVFSAEDTSARGFSHCMCALGVPSRADVDAGAAHAALLYAGLLRALPVPCRMWFSDLRDRSTSASLERYTATAVSAGLLAAEYAAVEEAAAGVDRFDKFSIRAFPAAREVVATMEVEEGHLLELVVRLPAALPLRPGEAECRRSVGVSEARLRKWLLSITAFLRNRNGAVAGALALWKRNIDNEFSGHEDCLICFSVVQPATGQLPRLTCRTCRQKFHGACLYKWFSSSGKSICPHCTSPW